MKNFKTIDSCLQALLIITCTALNINGSLNILYSYFIVGSYQLISMLVHEATKSFTRTAARRIYQNVVYVIVSCMLLTTVIDAAGFIFYPMIFLAPFMAVYYTWLCYKETFVYMKRPLSILK